MIETETRGRSRLSAVVVIIGSILALIVGAFVFANWNSYIVMGHGTLGVPRFVKEEEINARDLPALVEAVSSGSEDVRYAGLIFSAPDRPLEQSAVNLQFSFENGKVGFDWILLAPVNIEDQERFKAFSREHGVEPVSTTENGVSYLRVEDTDVAMFASLVITEIYKLSPDETLGLVHEGFDWPQR